jgi:outer membrane protein OmpU
MNKLNKIGVSALCGSLAAISAAKAGDLSVTGGVDMSWISYEKQDTGNPIGMGSNLTFSGSGELDNGWSVALSVANVNANAYSNTNVTVGVPGLGDFRISQGVSGSGIDRMDDMTPTVWEESYGAGLGTGIDTVSGASGGSNIEWTVDSGMTPDGLTARVVYSPKVGGSAASDKGSSGTSTSAKGTGWDLTLEASDALTGIEGLTVYGGISAVEVDQTAATWSSDVDERTVGAKYAMGSFTIGYQWSQEENGKATGATKYSNDGYGITFQVNDDLSIGYNHYESEQSNTSNVTAEATSYQIAYSMGGASIRLAEIQADNIQYSTAAIDDRDATVLSVSLAF